MKGSRSQIRVACSPLTGEIYAGKTLKDPTVWAEGKQDVTNQVLNAIIEKIRTDAPETKTLVLKIKDKVKYEIILIEHT